MVPIGEIVVVVGSMNMTDRLWVKFPFIFDENLGSIYSVSAPAEKAE